MYEGASNHIWFTHLTSLISARSMVTQGVVVRIQVLTVHTAYVQYVRGQGLGAYTAHYLDASRGWGCRCCIRMYGQCGRRHF